MDSTKLTFKGHAGDDLAARFDRPDGPHLATALFAHCFTCSKDIAAARRIAGRLAAMGIGVLRFDFTGLGHSGGEFANTHFSSNVADLVQAAEALEAMGHPVDLLIGHSLGGAAVLKAAGEIASAKGVVTIGAPADPAHVAHQFGDRLAAIRAEGAAEVSLGGRPFTIKSDFLDDIAAAALQPAVAGLKKALLILHAPTDQTVGIENAGEIFQAAKHPKSFVTLDRANHLLTDSADADYAASVIASWAGRYLDLSPPAAPIGAPEGVVRSTEADPAGFLQDIAAGPTHHILADEPPSFGGTDRGMTPYQLLSAALAACTAMTVRMYARRKGWALDHVSVDVTHDRIHASDCEHCESETGQVDRFRRGIVLKGTLDADARRRLLEIADRCPVHRTLHGAVTVETEEIT